MKTTRKYNGALAIIAISAFAALVPVAMAYVQQLHSEEVQEAFSLGRSTDPDTVKQFFEKYSRMLDCPASGPCVDSIELRTPYEQIAVRSRQHGSDYTEQDAEKDYAARPTKLSVHVFVLYPLDFSDEDTDSSASEGQPDSRDGSSFYGFRIRVSQDHAVKPAKIHGRSIDLGDSESAYSGEEEIILDFDPAQFDAEVIHIEVATPDGQTVKSEFDLRDLK
jgi:hypothetical protein